MKIVQATGQTCNQFWIYSNFIADAIEKNEKFAIWVPDIDFKHYPNLKNSSYFSFPLYSERLINVIGYNKYVKLLSWFFLNIYSLFFTKIIFMFIPNIDFKIVGTEHNKKNINRCKHIEDIKKIFEPKIESYNETNLLFSEIRQHYDLIIGIHIRYGDYRTFENGKYFFELEEYKFFIGNVMKNFNNEKVALFVASNEVINLEFFSDFNCFTNIKGSSTNDLIGLSKCDYIFGPPSTFSAWASLLKNVPLYFIEDINASITKDSFFHIEDVWL